MVLNTWSSVSSVTAFCKIYFKSLFNSNRVNLRAIWIRRLNCYLDTNFACKTLNILWAMRIPSYWAFKGQEFLASCVETAWDRLVTHSQVPEPTCYWKWLDGRTWGGEPVKVTHRLKSHTERSNPTWRSCKSMQPAISKVALILFDVQMLPVVNSDLVYMETCLL